jgi:TRAP-type C4-dicarboxylate transport system permease small subunit
MQIRIVVDRLPPGLAVVVQGLRRAVVLAILVFMTVMGAYYAQKVSAMTTLAMNVSRSVPTAAIPAGMGLMVIQYVLILLAGAAGRGEREVAP